MFWIGKVTGFSSIVFGVTKMEKANWQWKLSLICGMILAGSITFLIAGFDKLNGKKKIKNLHFNRYYTIFWWTKSTHRKFKALWICNSRILCWIWYEIRKWVYIWVNIWLFWINNRHGVCGLPRLAIRSYVGVGCFVGLGISNNYI